MKVLCLNGPNLNLLGQREPDVYGHSTLADIEQAMCAHAQTLNITLDFQQHNAEGALIDALHAAPEHGIQAVILNAAAYTHTSVALYDAVRAIAIPVIELHLSNIYAREPFRHHSYIAPAAAGILCGFGADGYLLALDAIRRRFGS